MAEKERQFKDSTDDEIIAGYIELRDRKDELKNELKKQTEEIDGLMAQLQLEMHERLIERKVEATKSEGGTAFFQNHTKHKVADWAKTLPFIVEGKHWNFLEARVSKSAVEEFMEQHEGQLPPGVTISQFQEVQFRKPAK